MSSAAVVTVPVVLLLASCSSFVYLRLARHRPERPRSERLDEDEAVNTPQFWARTRLYRSILILVLSLAASLRAFELGYHIALARAGSDRALLITLDALAFALEIVIAALTTFSLRTRQLQEHWRATLHVFVLLSLTTVSIWASILTPTESLVVRSKVELGLLWTETALITVAAWLAGSIDKAPLYRTESSQDGRPKDVVPLTAAGPLAFISFSWVNPLLKVAKRKPQIDAEDVPYLTPSMRARNLFLGMRASARLSIGGDTRSKAGRTEAALQRELGQCPLYWNRLMWRLLVVNKELFFAQAILAGITALCYYLPAFFLQKVVHFLEDPADGSSGADTRREQKRYGYAYCLGLFLSLTVLACLNGALWYLCNAVICSRFRLQLNTIVFEKTLRRKDISSGTASDDTRARNGDRVVSENGAKDAITSKKSGKEQDLQKKSDKDDDAAVVGIEAFKSKASVMNLFSVDVDRISDFGVWSFSLVDAPLELLIGTVFLYRLLGVSAILGILVNVLFLPLNHWAAKRFAVVQNKLMSARDKRVSLMSEVLKSIRMLKYNGWESAIEERIMATRREELKYQKYDYYLEATFDFIWSVTPMLGVLISFYFHTKVFGKTLTPSTAFAFLAVSTELEYALNCLPDTLVSLLSTLVSLRRIEAYLSSPDISEDAAVEVDLIKARPPTFSSPTEAKIEFRSATIAWPAIPAKEEDDGELETETPGGRRRFMLTDLDLVFDVGSLSVVCGPLGSGKTLLLHALLGEADVLAGQILAPKSPTNGLPLPGQYRPIGDDDWLQESLAYVPQTPWLSNASIRDNILFALPMNQDRYEEVLRVCSLEADLGIMEDGDLTEVGERGVTLSGGQKARVSLARAVYSRARHVYLDDVLSAVDSHTAQTIVKECLRGRLMRSRTIVLVTHHVALVGPVSDQIFALEHGSLAWSGTPDAFFESDAAKTLAEDAKSRPKAQTRRSSILIVNKQADDDDSDSGSDSSSESESEDEKGLLSAPRKLIEDEARAVGAVSRDVWKMHISAQGSAIFWTCFATLFIGTNALEIARTGWLARWTGSGENAVRLQDSQADSINFYLGIYALLTIGSVVISTGRWLILYNGSIRASTRIFKGLLHAVLKAPLRFHDTIAIGRLLNRFGKDCEVMDSELADHEGRSLIYALSMIVTVVTVSLVTPAFLLVFFLLAPIYVYFGRIYSRTARELRRLGSTTKSPVFSLYGEIVSEDGAAIVRAFGGSARYMFLLLQRVDQNITFEYMNWAVSRWLSVRFQILSAVIVGIAGFTLISADGAIDAALAGFALTFALELSNDLLFLVRRWTTLELAMVGMERIREYSLIDQEAADFVEPRPPAHWPHAGEIIFDEVSVRYAADLPEVLHEVSFSIKPGERVGIVGSTGSGKSSLAQSLFRLMEISHGSIIIDGKDIQHIGLADLRSRLTIVPQDPQLLSGTLRTTLDVFGEHEDSEIYDCLRRVHLLPSDEPMQRPEDSNNVFWDLDYSVNEGADNFSQGQKQLLCMCRALLKRTKVLILDEATASIDYETDRLIQKTIRSEFAGNTLIAIAHRLRTIMSFDRVLLLDAGRVVEFDAPGTLIDNERSRFFALCQSTGEKEFKTLRALAHGGEMPAERKRPKRPKRKSTMKS
ncbi:hypothetical protein E5Q_04155.1 [Mixia osmundae IAM 14324]|uniref:Uncharacterized protein n=2 Tax=Mixia osmundae (strain CBS 9802 / IAM 14324 / JCM 22182 / KY 12970) TaxID=764103 RepID=G7E3R6_MIXOS|nr:hypothetical protein E5Q_04155.1 [Mixia osmundae IAM 14324]